jgi:tRNA threonylcarbamoyl adenosine modification protein YeaZ
MNELFFACLSAFLSSAGVKLADIDRWVSITGPGSFTGIRIGIAAISGIVLGLGKSHIGLSALDAAALVSGRDKLAVAANIRSNEYALRHYDFINKQYSPIELITVAPADMDTLDIVFINGKHNTAGYDCLTKALLNPHVGDFLGSAVPLYVKRSEAEINFDKKSHNS